MNSHPYLPTYLLLFHQKLVNDPTNSSSKWTVHIDWSSIASYRTSHGVETEQNACPALSSSENFAMGASATTLQNQYPRNIRTRPLCCIPHLRWSFLRLPVVSLLCEPVVPSLTSDVNKSAYSTIIISLPYSCPPYFPYKYHNPAVPSKPCSLLELFPAYWAPHILFSTTNVSWVTVPANWVPHLASTRKYALPSLF